MQQGPILIVFEETWHKRL